jgi:hypothetical protein
MCGHGMVRTLLAKKTIDWIREGRRTEGTPYSGPPPP